MRVLSRLFVALLFILLLFIGLSRAIPWQLWRWDAVVQWISLLLCGVLCVVGLRLRSLAAHESALREEAEAELARQQQALERRIRERTRELSQEVEDRRRAEDLNRGQKQVLEMLTAPQQQKTEDILRHLTATVAAQRRSWECSLHLVDASGATLQLTASTVTNEKLRRYLVSIGADFPDAPEGQAYSSGKTFVVEKMDGVRRPWSELLVANGIFSAWSIPFRTTAEEKVTGTLTVYCRLHAGPSPRDLELTEAAAGLAGLVIEHRRIHDELVHNAYQDALTGVSNRRAGELALQTAIEAADASHEPLSIFWIDLDRFKRVNDQHGHRIGDIVLRAVARRLRAHPLVNGTLARMGGDEFLVLIPGEASINDAPAICRQLSECIAAQIATPAGVFSITASIGVSCYPRDGASIDALERYADFAMYRAKSTGAGSCIFSPAMSEEVRTNLDLEKALASAIENKQFRLVYQPIFHSDGHLHGFEALLRFRHPTLGEISPARFIPKAEETNLIVPIGEWVLREACRQFQSWCKAGLPSVQMGVNISALQLARSDFAQTVAAILCDCTVPPDLLTLELTETAVIGNRTAAVEQMLLLKEYGVRIALDDFGTGYSSLSYLHKLPFDVLKIDRSFTERLAETDGTRPIVEAIIAIARHLGVYVVAEGVETAEQQRILAEAGCNGLQGFLLARPLPPEEAGERLASAGAAECVVPDRREPPKVMSARQ